MVLGDLLPARAWMIFGMACGKEALLPVQDGSRELLVRPRNGLALGSPADRHAPVSLRISGQAAQARGGT